MEPIPLGHVDDPGEHLRQRLRFAALILVLLFGSYAYFFQSGDWNQNSRIDQARAFASGTLAIDAFAENTGDKAFFDGHYFSDKAPLAATVAALPFALVERTPLGALVGREPHHRVVVASYLAVLLASGVPTCATALILYVLALATGASLRVALQSALCFGLCTFAFPYATLLFGHALATALLFGCFAAAEWGRARWRWYVAGLLGGAAVAAEYTVGMAVLVVAIAAAIGAGRRHAIGAIGRFAIGTLPSVFLISGLAQLIYHRPWDLGYLHIVRSTEPGTVEHGFHGFGVPDPRVAVDLLLLPYRGLLFYAPALAFGLIGFRTATRNRRVAMCATIFALYLVVFSGFSYWYGGSSFGPRHLLPTLPFLGFAAIPVVQRWPRLHLALSFASLPIMLIATATSPLPGRGASFPLATMMVHLSLGDVATASMCTDAIAPAAHITQFGRPSDATNFGVLLGLHGVWSLVPLLCAWIFAAWWIDRAVSVRDGS